MKIDVNDLLLSTWNVFLFYFAYRGLVLIFNVKKDEGLLIQTIFLIVSIIFVICFSIFGLFLFKLGGYLIYGDTA